MTTNECSQMFFHAGMKVKHIPSGKIFDLISVDFEECLIGISEDDFYNQPIFEDEETNVKWFRCENCEIIE